MQTDTMERFGALTATALLKPRPLRFGRLVSGFSSPIWEV
jgi:hypothetical protein